MPEQYTVWCTQLAFPWGYERQFRRGWPWDIWPNAESWGTFPNAAWSQP